jgi:hypothetical protein
MVGSGAPVVRSGDTRVGRSLSPALRPARRKEDRLTRPLEVLWRNGAEGGHPRPDAGRPRAGGRGGRRFGRYRRKVIMVIMAEGKVIRRLPNTGGKVIKMITYMEMGDSCDRFDRVDTSQAAS